MHGRGRTTSTLGVALALCGIAAAGFVLRSTGAPGVFPDARTVVVENGDGLYHARLAHFSFTRFPEFLTWDWYLAGPLGGAVPWPPGFDLLVAATARLLGASGIDYVLAWSGPVLGTLAVFAVFAAARTIAGALPSLIAALLYAGFGITIAYSIVGGGDHHGFVSLLGAAWLALALGFVSPSAGPRRVRLLAAGIAAVRAAMLVGWSGSLLYVAIADGSVALVCVGLGDVRRLRAFGAGALASAALAAPFVAKAGVISGGVFSGITLSALHLCVVSAAGALALAAGEWERRRPAGSAVRRVLRTAAAVAAAGALLASSELAREQIAPALRFLTLRDASGAGTVEQLPLFPLFGRSPLHPATVYFGNWAWALPVAPLLALLAAADPLRRVPALLLAGWSAPLVALAVVQLRYGNDAAAPAAVCFAVGLAELMRLVQGWTRIPAAAAKGVAVALALALLAPALRDFAPEVPAALRHLVGRRSEAAAPTLDAKATLAAFARQVRAATPETPGFDDDGRPGYGVVGLPSIGHALRYYARRPVAADNFWDKFETYGLASGLLELSDEPTAVDRAASLGIRYVVTMPIQMPPDSLHQRLHLDDGRSVGGRPRLERLRLVTEGPRGGTPLLSPYGVSLPSGTPPYKLFEIVPGAVLEVTTTPGQEVVAEALVETPTSRRFFHRAEATADASGVARIRVPYADATRAPTRLVGPWRIRAGDADERSASVTDEEVETGAVVPVPQTKYDGGGAAQRP